MVPKAGYDAYTAVLDAQYADAASLLGRYIASFDWDCGFEQMKDQRNQVIRYMHSLVEVYGRNAAVAAADFYNLTALTEGADVPQAVLAGTADIDSVAASGRYAARSLWGGSPDVDGFRAQCIASMRKYIKRAANDTLAMNAARDDLALKRAGKGGVRWARVPRGNETCAFCIMLASRGFVYYSKQSADLFGHDHENCDCDIICSFTDGRLEGYDYRDYLAIYNANVSYDGYGHLDSISTLNNIRRSLHEEQRDRVNEVKRAWYRRNAESERERVKRYQRDNAGRLAARKQAAREADERQAWVEEFRRAKAQQEELGI